MFYYEIGTHGRFPQLQYNCSAKTSRLGCILENIRALKKVPILAGIKYTWQYLQAYKTFSKPHDNLIL